MEGVFRALYSSISYDELNRRKYNNTIDLMVMLKVGLDYRWKILAFSIANSLKRLTRVLSHIGIDSSAGSLLSA